MMASKAQNEAWPALGTWGLRLKVLSFNFTLCALSFTFLSACQNEQLYTDKQIMMGTFVEVISPSKEAPQIAFREIKRIENLLSKYLPGSEISRLNKSGKARVSPETFYIIKRAKEFYQETGGAFDISVAVLVELWGFADKNYRIPSDADIKRVLNLVGSDKIILDEQNNCVEFKETGMKIDLGAIAKGYALDCAVRKLRQKGVTSCLINAGGQIYCLGTKPRPLSISDILLHRVQDKCGLPWKVAIRSPWINSRPNNTIGCLELKDESIATSGSYEQYFIRDKKRYSHLLNPKTGYPAQSDIAQVNVIAPDGLTADALATAIFVLGQEKGRVLANKFPAAKIRIDKEGS